MPLRPWRRIARRTLLEVPPWLTAGTDHYELPDGKQVPDMVWMRSSDYTLVIALTPGHEVILERCFKPGIGHVSLVAPAGGLQAGEDPLAGAKRELLEETGHVSDAWTFLGQYRMDPNYGLSVAHLFLARDARRVAEPHSGDLEEMEIVLMPLAQALDALKRGEIETLGSAAGLGLAAAELARP